MNRLRGPELWMDLAGSSVECAFSRKNGAGIWVPGLLSVLGVLRGPLDLPTGRAEAVQLLACDSSLGMELAADIVRRRAGRSWSSVGEVSGDVPSLVFADSDALGRFMANVVFGEERGFLAMKIDSAPKSVLLASLDLSYLREVSTGAAVPPDAFLYDSPEPLGRRYLGWLLRAANKADGSIAVTGAARLLVRFLSSGESWSLGIVLSAESGVTWLVMVPEGEAVDVRDGEMLELRVSELWSCLDRERPIRFGLKCR